MKTVIYYIKFFFISIIGWFIIRPIFSFLPKNKKRMVFIGRDNGKFLDSIKAFYLYMHEITKKTINIYFITENIETYNLLKLKKLPVLKYFSVKAFYTLLRANIVVVDNWQWIQNLKYHLVAGSKKIQIWHGVPLKKIELDNPTKKKGLSLLKAKIYNTLEGRYPKFFAVVSTSDFYTKHAFSKAFKAKNIITSGYPRNDVFFNSSNKLIWENTDLDNIKKIKQYKKEGYKIILYAPTFRDTGGDAIVEKALNLKTLSFFAKKNKFIFVLKFHPHPKFSYNISNHEFIVEYNNNKDVYPFIPLTDLLITDYSSIYFDYLLLNKPILFFPYDKEKYMKKDRNFIFDYEKMTPGLISYNQNELEENILKTIDKDSFKSKRDMIKKLAFTYHDGQASERIWTFIREKILLK